ncbi:MAG: HD domain-containing protein, partial [Planctomycetes bacterium]|nr:HD domain-containing protein [Planctomycetota bacterium]
PYDVGEATLMVIALVEKWNLTREWVATVERKSEELNDTTRLLDIVNSCQRELQTAHNDLKAEAYQQRNRLDQQSTEMIGTRDVTVLALAQLAESRDPKIGQHIERMRTYSQILAGHLSNHGPYQHLIDDQFLEDLYRSTPLHDIGKIGIPDEILLKPGPLTSKQFEIMKKHVLLGVEALEKTIQQSEFAEFLQMAVDIAKYHHERYDGNGYPSGLAGQEIPLSARIVTVADVFDALTSSRVYKEAIEPDAARAIIEADGGKQFDPVVLSAFQERFDDLKRAKTMIDESGADWNASFGFGAPTNPQSVCANDPHEN